MKNRVFSVTLTIALALALAFSTALTSFGAVLSEYDKVYQWNKTIYDSRSTSEDALKFYKENIEQGRVPINHPVIIALSEFISKNKKTDYEKARAIFEWVTGNIWYDYDYRSGKRSELMDYERKNTNGIVSVIGAIKYSRGTCNHMAHLAVALLRASNISARIIYGQSVSGSNITLDDYFIHTEKYDGYDGGNHVWVEAFVNGKWIIIEPTAGASMSYRNGTYSKQRSGNIKYFDMTLEELSKNRVLAIRYDSFVTDITIPDGATAIGDWGLSWWWDGPHVYLKNITIPASVKSIGDNAFRGIPAAASLTIFGEAGSYAEKYARERPNTNFVATTSPVVENQRRAW